MPIHVRWYNEQQHAIVYEFSNWWRWQDLDAANTRANEMAAHAPEAVSHIIDLRHSSILPTNVLNYLQGLSQHTPTNYNGLMVIVGASPFVKILIRLIKNTYLRQIHIEALEVTNTLEEAAGLVVQHRIKRQLP